MYPNQGSGVGPALRLASANKSISEGGGEGRRASSFSLECLLSHLGAPWVFDSRGVLRPSRWTSYLRSCTLKGGAGVGIWKEEPSQLH